MRELQKLALAKLDDEQRMIIEHVLRENSVERTVELVGRIPRTVQRTI